MKVITFRIRDNLACWWAMPVHDADADMVVQIGRKPSSDMPESVLLTIPEGMTNADTVSRNHARLIRRNGAYWVQDLSLTNPTSVDGRAVLSFREVALPFELRLGDMHLKVTEEDLTKGQIREGRQAVSFLPANAYATHTLDNRLRNEWPDIREELRWSDALSQILAAVREASSPAAARTRVSELLAIFLNAQRTAIHFGVGHAQIDDTLRRSGLKQPGSSPDLLKNLLPRGRQAEQAACVPIPKCSCVYALPPTFGAGRKTLNLCIAEFHGPTPMSAIEPAARRLTGLAITLLDTFGVAVEEIHESRATARARNPLEPSARMKELCAERHYWGEAPLFKKMLVEADRAARKDLVERKGDLASILFVGERGVGKSALARIIHAMSDHAAGPFVEMNCAAIVETLAEAQLFGSVKGMGTGVPEVKGFFETAQNGTLFMDEIGALKPDIQAKLLNVLASGAYRRLGEASDRTANCHIIAATNADLETLMAEGMFREDLYDRICTCQILIPPLRERPEDVPLLLDQEIDRLNHDKKLIEKLETPVPKFLNPALRGALCAYAWPGNVRTLVKNLDAAFRRAEDLEIVFDDLPEKFRKEMSDAAAVCAQSGFAVRTDEALDRNVKRLDLEYCARLMRQFNGAVGKVAEKADMSNQTFLDRRKKDFPVLVAQMADAEVARLQELAGPHWNDLVKTAEFPATIADLQEKGKDEEVERLRDLAGPHWDELMNPWKMEIRKGRFPEIV